MALLRGQRHTRAITADIRDREIQQDIIMKQSNRAPFTSLLMALPSKATFAPKFEHAEDDTLVPYVTVSGSHNASVTTIQLGTGEAARVRRLTQLLYKNASGEVEVLVVDSVNYALDQLTVQRAQAGTSGRSMTDGDKLVLASEAQEEGVKFVDAISGELDLLYNYVEEVETPVEASWLQMAVKDITERDWLHQTNLAMIEHKEKLERMYWFGHRDKRVGPNGKNVYYTGGLYWFLSSATNNDEWKRNYGGSVLTKAGLDDWMRYPMRYGDIGRKVIFASPWARMRITAIAEGFQRIAPSEKTLGMEITKISLNGRVIPIIETQVFDKLGFESYLFMVDMSMVQSRYLQGGGKTFQTRWYPNQEEKGTKGQKDVLYSVQGLQIKNVLSHGMAYNFA